MAGRFPLYTDNDVLGALVKALRGAGWDVLRGVDSLPKRAPDPEHFEKAATLDRALVIGDLLRKFDELAAKDHPFDPDYPIVRIKPD